MPKTCPDFAPAAAHAGLRPDAKRRALRRRAAAAGLLALAVGLGGCASGGTPWGATPQNLSLPRLPDLSDVPARVDATTTAGTVRLEQRVRAALAAQPELADVPITVTGLEGGTVVLSGSPRSAEARALALRTARGVAGVGQVIDRMADAP